MTACCGDGEDRGVRLSGISPDRTGPALSVVSLSTPTKASYVRFFIDSVQGETLTLPQAAELQVFGDAVGVAPTAPPADPDFTDRGTIVTGNPAASQWCRLAVDNVWQGRRRPACAHTCWRRPACQTWSTAGARGGVRRSRRRRARGSRERLARARGRSGRRGWLAACRRARGGR